jgi:ribonuclease BN (tRNA processing enzyme)
MKASGGSSRKALLAISVVCAAALALSGETGRGSQTQTPRQILSRELKPGQAVIWYLYHSGWAVKTKNDLLIFDYTEPPARPPNRSLDSGAIDPSEIADENVTVFISHRHSDHYDPIILEWRTAVKRIRYVWGWEDGGT